MPNNFITPNSYNKICNNSAFLKKISTFKDSVRNLPLSLTAVLGKFLS